MSTYSNAGLNPQRLFVEAALGEILQWIMKERLGKWKKHGVGYVLTDSRAQLRIV
jgi:hypothetical protein